MRRAMLRRRRGVPSRSELGGEITKYIIGGSRCLNLVDDGRDLGTAIRKHG